MSGHPDYPFEKERACHSQSTPLPPQTNKKRTIRIKGKSMAGYRYILEIL